MAPWAQAQVWALVKVNEAKDLQLTDGEIADMVTKVGPDGKPGDHPSKNCIKDYRHTFASDDEWYPGKTWEEGEKRGPKKQMTGQKANAIAQAAMAIKREGLEPTVPLVRQRCDKAAINEKTDAPFTDQTILRVFTTRCKDDGSDMPWSRINPLQKTALPQFLMDARFAWATQLQADGATPGWFHRHCVWVDPCYNILTESPRQAFNQDMAKYGKGKRWGSEDMRTYARNQRASPYGGKQQQFGDRKVWWFIVLTRGKIHIEVMATGWRQTGLGMAAFVDRLPRLLPRMVGAGAALPRVIVSDRGPGFYQSSTGHICNEYSSALQAHGFRAFAGADASTQPPDCADVFLHETAVAWIRNYMRTRPFSRHGSLDAQQTRLEAMLLECEQHINSNHDVDGLCRQFPRRMEELVDAEGGRLKY